MVPVMHWTTPEDRRNFGQSRRKQVGRQEHDSLNVKARTLTALALLERMERGRLPALLSLKRQLMSQSPFAYFRGAACVMAADLAVVPNTGIEVQLCGDAHVRNLGAFAAPDGRLVFDINDFDESIRGPFEWDLKRMATSLVVAGRASNHKEGSAREAVESCIGRYCAKMRAFSKMPMIEIARYQVHRLGGIQPVHEALTKAERATPLHTLERLTEATSNKPGIPRRFRESKPTMNRLTPAQAEQVLQALRAYRETLEPQRQHLFSMYRPIDIAFKVVGTGSIGLRDYCVYFEGNGPEDPLFLQVKEEAPSVYSPYVPNAHPVPHNGQRVVMGQRAMQVQSDPFLGWTNAGSRQFMVRQFNDHKGSIELEDLAGPGLAALGEVCGELLARGHARSGDPRVIAGYLGTGDSFAEALGRFGSLYADQTERDWQALRRSGKVRMN
jgi:uncharacterized protein (DUF2252 family)